MFRARNVPAQLYLGGLVETEAQAQLNMAERKSSEAETMQLPWSEGCYLCGEANPLGLQVKFNKERDRVYTEYCVDERRVGYDGQAHGGIVAALLDETMGWAVALAIGRMCITAEMTIRYMKPVPVGTRVIVSAKPGMCSRRLGVADGEVRDADGTLYARGSGKFLPISREETLRVDSQLIYPKGLRNLFNAAEDAPREDESS